jgi:hypothetical protein
VKNKGLQGKIADECENKGDTGELRFQRKKRDSELPRFHLLSMIAEEGTKVKEKVEKMDIQ